MKKIMLALALVAGLSRVSLAQDTKQEHPHQKGDKTKLSLEDRAKRSANRAEKEFTLTADQKTKWEAATLERLKANAPLHEKMKGSTTPDERKKIHAEAKTNIDKFETTVKGFLTAEQKTKFDAKTAEIKKKREEHRKKNKEEPHDIDDQD
jgi:periplasmic protein CpxP/Spy